MANPAAQFVNANSESLSITHASQTGLNPGDVDYYIAGWFRFDNLSTNQRLVTKWGQTGNVRSYLLGFQSSGANIIWAVSQDGTNATFLNETTFPTLAIDTWYFIEAWHDATANIIGVRLNRANDATASHTTGTYSSATSKFILGDDNDGGAGLDGLEQSVCFYSAIPSTEVMDNLYNSGNGVDYDCLSAGDKTNLVSWWDMTEVSGTRFDFHGSNDLTDNNTVTQGAGIVTCTPAPSGSTPVPTMPLLGIG